MDARGAVLPEGMPEVASAGPEHTSFFTPHHQFLYGGDGALKYTMSPAYSNEFAFAPQVDANAFTFAQQPHQLQFSSQNHSQQAPIQSPLSQQTQPHFGDPYAAQQLRQHVRQSPSTISPSQLQPQQPQRQHSYNQPPLTWDGLAGFSNDNNQLQNISQQQSAATLQENSISSTPVHRTTLIAPNTEQSQKWGAADSNFAAQNPLSDGTIAGEPAQTSNLLTGCYWCTVEPESNVPEQWTENLQYFWRMKIEEAGNKPAKSQKRTSSQALPPSPIDLSGDSPSMKRAKIEKAAKAASVKKTPAKPLPADPIERLKEQVTRLMRVPDLSDPGKLSSKFWELMQDAGADSEKRLALIRTASKEGSPEVFRT
ncbi:hypothetical protein BDZ91DRAFT_527425 [Kalaharituber pfeilii]|nr:hypothetical protein BDZ91DRAFT_527425 [Kalaharituber pfeilii]